VAFDVFRGALLHPPGGDPPAASARSGTSVTDERSAWQQLALLWFRGVTEATEAPRPATTLVRVRYAVVPLSGVTLIVVAVVGLIGTAYLA